MVSYWNTGRFTLLFLLFVLFGAAGMAQGNRDGEIVERKRVVLSEEERSTFLERNPGRDGLLDSIRVEAITYLSDGLRVKGYLVVPIGDGPFPCIISNRGGNREFGAISNVIAVSRLGRMAQWGYAVVASQYRGVAGGEGTEEFGGADVDDVLNLIPLLESLPEADATRIGMWGGSRGGLMTYLALTKTDRILGAVVSSGASDSYNSVLRRPELETNVFAELVPGWENDREAALTARSPVRWAEKLHPSTPLLLLHGTADWRVDPIQALGMANALFALKHPFRLVLFEGADHSLSEFRPEADRVTREFLDRYVRDRSPLPDMEPHGR